MKKLAFLLLLAPVILLAQPPFQEQWSCAVDSPATCLGDIWQEDGHTFALVGTATGVAIVSDTGIVWQSDNIGSVTAVARIDFGLGDGPEIFATTVGAETGILHHYFGEDLSNSDQLPFGEHYFHDDQPGEYDFRNERRATFVTACPSTTPDSLKQVIICCKCSNGSGSAHSGSHATYGKVFRGSLSNQEIISSANINSPESSLCLDINGDGHADFITAGWSEYSSEAYQVDWSVFGSDAGLNVFEAGIDSIRNVNLASFSDEAAPGRDYPRLGAIAEYTSPDGSTLLVSYTDTRGHWYANMELSEFTVTEQVSSDFEAQWIGVIHQNDGDFCLAYRMGVDFQSMAVLLTLPDFHEIDRFPFAACGLESRDLDGDDHEELVCLTQDELIVYGINTLDVPGKDPKPNPSTVTLSPAFPNPFNSTATISYSLPAAGRVTLGVYDLSGRLVERLVDEDMTAGRHVAVWEAEGVAAGVYFCRIETEQGVKMQKMMLLK